MTCLVQYATFLPLAICSQVPTIPDRAYQPPQPLPAATTRSELPAAVLQGSTELVARNNLAGTWTVSYLEYDGQPRPDVAAGLEMKFMRGQLELMQRGRPTVVVAYSLNPTKSPLGFSWKLPRPHT